MEYRLIGQKIKKARNEKDLTQDVLAEELDVSVSFISQVESGKKKFNLERIAEISQILEKPIDYFVEGYAPHNDDDIAEINSLLKKMSSTKIKLSLDIIKSIYNVEEIY